METVNLQSSFFAEPVLSLGQWRATRALQDIRQVQLYLAGVYDVHFSETNNPAPFVESIDDLEEPFGDSPLWGEIRQERARQFLGSFCPYIWGVSIVTLAQNLMGLRQVRQSVSLHCQRALGHLQHRRVGWGVCTKEACHNRMWGCHVGELLSLSSVLPKHSVDAVGMNQKQSKAYCTKANGLSHCAQKTQASTKPLLPKAG